VSFPPAANIVSASGVPIKLSEPLVPIRIAMINTSEKFQYIKCEFTESPQAVIELTSETNGNLRASMVTLIFTNQLKHASDRDQDRERTDLLPTFN